MWLRGCGCTKRSHATFPRPRDGHGLGRTFVWVTFYPETGLVATRESAASPLHCHLQLSAHPQPRHARSHGCVRVRVTLYPGTVLVVTRPRPQPSRLGEGGVRLTVLLLVHRYLRLGCASSQPPSGATSLFAPPGTPSAFFVRSLPEPKLLSGQSPGSDLDSYKALGFALCDLYFVEAL